MAKSLTSRFFHQHYDDYKIYITPRKSKKGLQVIEYPNQETGLLVKAIQSVLDNHTCHCGAEDCCDVKTLSIINGRSDLIIFDFTDNKYTDINTFTCSYCEDGCRDHNKYIKMDCSHKAHYTCVENYYQFRGIYPTECLVCASQSGNTSNKSKQNVIANFYFENERQQNPRFHRNQKQN